jgi:hypothetical protein
MPHNQQVHFTRTLPSVNIQSCVKLAPGTRDENVWISIAVEYRCTVVYATTLFKAAFITADHFLCIKAD